MSHTPEKQRPNDPDFEFAHRVLTQRAVEYEQAEMLPWAEGLRRVAAWLTDERGVCGATNPGVSAWPCALQYGHAGSHENAAASWPRPDGALRGEVEVISARPPETAGAPTLPTPDELFEMVREYGSEEYDLALSIKGVSPSIDTVMATRRKLLDAIKLLHDAATTSVNVSAGRADDSASNGNNIGKVTRFEVIDHRNPPTLEEVRGRVFTAKDCRVELSYQDAGRTLKVFVDEPAGESQEGR